MAFTFQYKPAGKGWLPRPDTYKTSSLANRAAERWANNMAREGCPVEVRVMQLISDGRGGMIPQEDF